MVIVFFLIAGLLIAVYPIRVRVQALLNHEAILNIYFFWQPLFFLDWQRNIKSFTNISLGELLLNKKDSNNARLTKDDFQQLLSRFGGSLNIEQLQIQANLKGNPCITALVSGLLWSSLSFGLGVLSTKVKSYPRYPVINFALQDSQFSYGKFETQIMASLYDVLAITFFIIKRNKALKNK